MHPNLYIYVERTRSWAEDVWRRQLHFHRVFSYTYHYVTMCDRAKSISWLVAHRRGKRLHVIDLANEVSRALHTWSFILFEGALECKNRVDTVYNSALCMIYPAYYLGSSHEIVRHEIVRHEVVIFWQKNWEIMTFLKFEKKWRINKKINVDDQCRKWI